ncbi:hypothetical protein [Virgibacillus halodenitrificans]|uniref:Uncharacterized protein n=1 Tax=Virgibacillus halodenitrificans TaxID=1482 RepID=A0ABR7VHV1_VIRHA|nr:hypothetical protein [Virgibacillus halodenitrificans]MBD1221515.1 hypothetical protein [Virgibacillus halodenitrificans]
MANYCRGITYWTTDNGPSNGLLCTSDTTNDVKVSITVDTGCALGGCCAHSNWKMRLQRYENDRWNTIGTRTGYVCSDDPSHRTFTNVLRKNAPMRVLVYFESDGQTVSSKQWVR